MNLYDQSLLGNKFRLRRSFTKQRISHRLSVASLNLDRFSTYAKSFDFLFFINWIAVGNLIVTFTSFTFNQYARLVDKNRYQSLIDTYGQGFTFFLSKPRHSFKIFINHKKSASKLMQFADPRFGRKTIVYIIKIIY